jgi:hypothetical protein
MKWRFGNVKEKTRRFGKEASRRNERSSKKKGKRSGRLLERGSREIFGNIVGSSVEGSLTVLVIFRCV